MNGLCEVGLFWTLNKSLDLGQLSFGRRSDYTGSRSGPIGLKASEMDGVRKEEINGPNIHEIRAISFMAILMELLEASHEQSNKCYVLCLPFDRPIWSTSASRNVVCGAKKTNFDLHF